MADNESSAEIDAAPPPPAESVKPPSNGKSPAGDSNPSRQWVRLAVQSGFIVSVLLVGWQFHLFVISLGDTSGAPLADRPESVEAWLPISSFMSLTLLAKSGIVNTVRPAGLVIFCLILLLTVAVRRGFCSWVCPIGTLSEYTHKAGRKVLGRNFTINRWIDYPLRAIKYLLLAFFLWAILQMPTRGLYTFIHGDYNRIADVKMYLLFANISMLTICVFAALIVLSAIFKNFWCRYLCPYGALLGALSLLSPITVRRDPAHCGDCGRCSKVCPNSISVSKASRVKSAECTACYSCVSACPKPGALGVSIGRSKRTISLLVYGVITVAAFVLVTQAARAVGYWQSDTSDAQYRELYHRKDEIGHMRTPGAMQSAAPPRRMDADAFRRAHQRHAAKLRLQQGGIGQQQSSERANRDMRSTE